MPCNQQPDTHSLSDPTARNYHTDQVFERSQLYRWIATPGNMRIRWNVSHLINQQFVPRQSVWNLVRAVSADLQAVLYSRETGFESRVSGWKSTNSWGHCALQRHHEGIGWSVCTICKRLLHVRFYRISYVCIPYFISVTDRREIVEDDDLSSASDSDSVLEMFSIPPLGRPSQQQRQERLSSSLSNTTTNSTHSPANESVSNAACRRVPLGPFVFTSNGRTGIRSKNHANGLIGILQLAGAHPSGLIGTLGYHNQQTWFQENVDAIFQSDGPLGSLTEFHTWY